MPNYCQNTLIVEGDKAQLADFKSRCIVEDKFTMNILLPMPRGLDGWYQWSCDNWGTKWDAIDTYRIDESVAIHPSETDSITILYSTAWSPNRFWVETVSKMFPGLKLLLYYEESGCFFCGQYEVVNGIEIVNKIGDLLSVDDDNNEVYWDNDIERYRYTSTSEIIDDEEFYPNHVNRFHN